MAHVENLERGAVANNAKVTYDLGVKYITWAPNTR